MGARDWLSEVRISRRTEIWRDIQATNPEWDGCWSYRFRGTDGNAQRREESIAGPPPAGTCAGLLNGSLSIAEPTVNAVLITGTANGIRLAMMLHNSNNREGTLPGAVGWQFRLVGDAGWKNLTPNPGTEELGMFDAPNVTDGENAATGAGEPASQPTQPGCHCPPRPNSSADDGYFFRETTIFADTPLISKSGARRYECSVFAQHNLVTDDEEYEFRLTTGNPARSPLNSYSFFPRVIISKQGRLPPKRFINRTVRRR